MKNLKRISMKNASDLLSIKEMKCITGGYDGPLDGYVFFKCIGEGGEITNAGISSSCSIVMDRVCDPSEGVWCMNI